MQTKIFEMEYLADEQEVSLHEDQQQIEAANGPALKGMHFISAFLQLLLIMLNMIIQIFSTPFFTNSNKMASSILAITFIIIIAIRMFE